MLLSPNQRLIQSGGCVHGERTRSTRAAIFEIEGGIAAKSTRLIV